MAVAKIGFGTAVGIALESTWGTAIAHGSIVNWLRVTSLSLAREVEYVDRPHLGTTRTTPEARRTHFLASDKVAGGFEWIASYDDSTTMMMVHALGTVATTGTAAPYTHTCTLGPLPTGLTVEGLYGNQANEIFEGCKINTLTLSIEAGGLMTAAVELLGQTSGGLIASAAATHTAAGEPITFSHAGTFSFNSVNYTLKSLEITLDNKLTERMLLESANTLEPTRSDFPEVTMTATLEFGSNNLYSAMIADTESDAAITFTGAGDNAMTFTLHNAYVVSATQPVSSAGVLEQTVTFRGQSDATDLGLKVAMSNDNASAIGAAAN